MPASVATRWTWASCLASSHCSQQWKVTRASCSAANSATAAVSAASSGAGQSSPGSPCTSASAHQVANRSRPGPSATRHVVNSGPGAVASKSNASAARLDSQTVSRSRVSSALRSRAATPIRSIWARAGSASAAYSSVSSIRRYDGLANRRVVGRYGDASIGATGSAACSGFTSTKPAPSPADQRASVARSARSPRPHEPAERTWYSCVITPQTRSRPSAAGSGNDAGETSRVAVARGPSSGSACSRCQPGGRSPGSSTVARPTRRPSTSRGGTQWSTCRTSRVLPSSSSISTSTDAPSVTWTDTQGVHPTRATTVGGSTRRQSRSSASSWAAATCSGVAASTPRPASTATSVSAVTGTCCPCQSQ